MQTAFEAINNLLHHRRADHVPMTDGPWGDTLKKWVTQGMPANDKGEPVDAMDHFGFDGLHPMEVKAGNDIFRIAEGYGDKLMFVGGLDARILESHDRGLIRKGVTDLIQGMRSRGARYVYGSDHSISTNVDYADFQYSLEVYRENMVN
jgi:uroporphyrinogen-III decarboxylase